MASTHIGDVTFGVAAYTKELKNTKKQIDDFGKQVIKTANDQQKGYQKVVKALTAQEVAMRKASAATNALAKSVQKAKLSEEQENQILTQLNANLNAHVAVLGKVKSSAHDVAVAQTKFNSALKTSSTEIKDAKNKLKGMSDVLRNMESAAVLAIGPLSGVGARIRSLGSIASRSSLGIVVFIGSVVAAGVALWKMSAAAINASKVFESSMARFKAATGSMKLARAEMNFVIKTSLQLGLRIEDTTKAYSRLSAASKGTALEGAGVRKVFLGVSKAAAALRLSQGEVEGAFRAIEQMMSKGSVQAEELRGQLGERLPGAFRLAAEAMNMTTMELGKALKAGEVMAEDFLPRLAEALSETFGKDAEDNINSYTGSMNNLSNQTLLFAQEWDRVTNTSGIFIKAINMAAKSVEWLKGALEFAVKSVVSLGAAMAFYYGPAILGMAVKGFRALAVYVRGTAAAQWLLNAAMLANPIGLVAKLTLKLTAALVVMIGTFVGLDLAMESNTEEMNKAADAAAKAADGLRELSKSAEGADAVGKLTSDIAALSAELEDLEGAKGFAKSADEVELYARSFAAVRKAQSMGKDGGDELKAQAEALNAAFGRLGIKLKDVEPTADSVGAAFFRLSEYLRLSQERAAASVTAVEELAAAQLEAAIAAERLAISSQGTKDDLKHFDQVTVKVLEYRASLLLTDQTVLQRSQSEREYRDALTAAYEANKIASENEKKRDAALKASIKSADMLAKAEQTLADQRARLVAAQGGAEALKYYDKVTKGVNKYRDAILDAKMSEEERADALLVYEKVLAQILAAEEKITAERKATAEATKQLTADEKEHMKAVSDYFKIMGKADDQLEKLRASNKALSEGPESFEYFTEVTSKVMAYEAQLEKLVANSTLGFDEMKAKVAEFQAALEDERGWKKIAELSNNMANAVGNSLESLFTGTKSLKDSFKDLAAELWNMLLRALIIDPIIKSLSASFSSFMGGGGSGGGSFGNIFSGIMGMFGGGGVQGGVTSLLGGAGMFAEGGSVQRNSNILVGEDGPEFLTVGSRGAHVTSNDDAKAMFNGESTDKTYNSTSITVNLPPQRSRHTAMQTASQVNKIQKRAAGRNS